MQLNIAFIGYNTAQTYIYFQEFIACNIDQISRYNSTTGFIVLKDGTQIYRVAGRPESIKGRHFDQILVAKDRQTYTGDVQTAVLMQLYNCLTLQVPEHLQIIIYDLDSEEGKT